MTPEISVLLATYSTDGSNQEYLDLCLKSLAAQTYQNFEVVLVSSGFELPRVKQEKVFHFHSKDRLHFPAAIKAANLLSNKGSKFIFLLNDDVILNKFCIDRLHSVVAANDLFVNPHSNCDDGRFYISNLPYNKVQYRIDEMKSLCDEIIQREEWYPPFLLFQDIVHFYATMMRRDTYERLGGIDENFKTGFDDRDLSWRAQSEGIKSAIYLPAYALHASGVSADKYLSQEDREFNQNYFIKKHQAVLK
jgi:GT2 family glycosyltransferase